MSAKRRPRKNRYKRSPVNWKKYMSMTFQTACLLFTIAGMSALFIFFHDVLTQCAYFEAKMIEIEGENLLTEEQVREQAQINIGKNILSINLNVTHKRLMAHPWIIQANIKRELPDKIVVVIKEQRPLAIVELDAQYLLNGQGEIFKKLEPEDKIMKTEALVVVKGLDYSDLTLQGKPASNAFKAVIDILHVSQNRNIHDMQIRSIAVDRDIGLTLSYDKRVNSVAMGFNEYSLKYNQLDDLLTYLDHRNECVQIEFIDLKSVHQVVVKPTVL